jgi:hypothetical protein
VAASRAVVAVVVAIEATLCTNDTDARVIDTLLIRQLCILHNAVRPACDFSVICCDFFDVFMLCGNLAKMKQYSNTAQLVNKSTQLKYSRFIPSSFCECIC